MYFRTQVRILFALLCLLALSATTVRTQNNTTFLAANEKADEKAESNTAKPIVVSVIPKYYHPQDGISVNELIKRGLESNQELVATRLEIDKARARLKQAQLRPNPTLEVEQSSGTIFGSPGGEQYSVGASLPLEIYGRRKAQISVAEIEVEASEAGVRNRERILASQILFYYADALAALRELDVTEQLLELDMQTIRFVQIRINEGDAAPLEGNLLMAEAERLRSRRQLVEGKLETAFLQIKTLTGIPFEESLRLREQINTALLPTLPATQEAAIDLALKIRPDVQLANIEEQLANAGLQLIKATSKPDLTAYTRFTTGRLGFDTSQTGRYQSWDSTLTVGISVVLPFFNKNQGSKEAAEIAVRQAQNRREFSERVVRGEILAAYRRLESAQRAVKTLETAAIPRSTENVETFRRVYEIGNIKITDLINEQRRLLDASRDLTEALTLRYRAQVDLNIALGAGGLLPEIK